MEVKEKVIQGTVGSESQRLYFEPTTFLIYSYYSNFSYSISNLVADFFNFLPPSKLPFQFSSLSHPLYPKIINPTHLFGWVLGKLLNIN